MNRVPAVLLCLLALSGCGDLPQPFRYPGATALRLARPPPARLAVPVPPGALLTDDASRAFASQLATALQDKEVPAVAGPVHRGDWRLIATAEQSGGAVTPTYTVLDPKGRDKGATTGAPIPADRWAQADPATIAAAAAAAAPGVNTLLQHIEAAVVHADPHSLYNRPAKVAVLTVVGAPGDGDSSLTRAMRTVLGQRGPIVQDSAAGADFTVQGTVRVVPEPGGQVRVEIRWAVKDATGAERGTIVQLNEVSPDSIQPYWGDVAQVVAQTAAGGVTQVLFEQTGRSATGSHTDAQAQPTKP